jgi:hypothetical protein
VGDWESARRVDLVLPETGVCSVPSDLGEVSTSCCSTSTVEAVPVGLIRKGATPRLGSSLADANSTALKDTAASSSCCE